MKHYKLNNEIYAFESDGSQDHLITADMVAISDEELVELQKPTAEQLKEQTLAEAKAYLAETDWVVIKINEAQVLGESVADLLTKYKDVLDKRQESRVILNQGV